jgi:hypothetical protein
VATRYDKRLFAGLTAGAGGLFDARHQQQQRHVLGQLLHLREPDRGLGELPGPAPVRGAVRRRAVGARENLAGARTRLDGDGPVLVDGRAVALIPRAAREQSPHRIG